MMKPPTQVNGHTVDFIRKKSGEIQPILANVAALLRDQIYVWSLGYDEFSNRMYRGAEPLEDRHFLELTEWVQHKGILAGADIVAAATQHIARERPFHQVRDYLELLDWDQKHRLEGMLAVYAGAPQTSLVATQSVKWMIQAVARIYEPGCQADATLVFEGDQGLGKSSFFRVLFSDLWFTDHLPDLTSKDALLQLRGIWCVEIAELASFSKHDSKRINQFLTSRIDRYRDPYGRLVADYPRQNVFAGTVNPGSGGYLKDETGARRFWSVPTSDNMDLKALETARDQLWAEAVHRYRAGELWYLNNRAMALEAAEAQAERYIGDPWADAIESFLHYKTETTTQELLSDCLNLTAKADWGMREMMRVSAILSHLKWERFRKPKDEYGKRSWAYRRTSQTSAEPTQEDEPSRSESGLIDPDIF